MAQLTIRDIDVKIVERLKVIARANGRSLEAELRALLAVHAASTGAHEQPIRYETRTPFRAILEPMPTSQVFRRPKPVKLPPVVPMKVEGKPVSATLIEDRR